MRQGITLVSETQRETKNRHWCVRVLPWYLRHKEKQRTDIDVSGYYPGIWDTKRNKEQTLMRQVITLVSETQRETKNRHWCVRLLPWYLRHKEKQRTDIDVSGYYPGIWDTKRNKEQTLMRQGITLVSETQRETKNRHWCVRVLPWYLRHKEKQRTDIDVSGYYPGIWDTKINKEQTLMCQGITLVSETQREINNRQLELPF
jgi:hypothetical protein